MPSSTTTYLNKRHSSRETHVLAEAKNSWADSQRKLLLMNYPQLSDTLATPGIRPKGNLELLLHMGCGEYTSGIVTGSLDSWKWAQVVKDGFQKLAIWIYTMLNIEESIYHDVPATPVSKIGIKTPRVE